MKCSREDEDRARIARHEDRAQVGFGDETPQAHPDQGRWALKNCPPRTVLPSRASLSTS